MRIGVTGIFASGKGTVCSMFEKLGAGVIDTDIIAREIMEPGQEGLAAVINEFGGSFVTAGRLDRRAFANHVFKDGDKVARLNEITHPLIEKLTLERSMTGIFMINVPLLFEVGFDKIMDQNIVVFSERSQAIERGMLRDNISENDIEARLKFQIPLNEKKQLADYVIDNSGSLENTQRQV
ncbi:MAG: dephospho-CoA kinase, partial [Leptospirales bacterium]|nr:dephospho-CoA kinase [Leptospirales bacterium]